MEDRYLFKGKEKDSGKWLEWNAIAGIQHNVTILTDTICQCTGLKDKNGNMIWENDVIKYHFGNVYAQIRYGAYKSCFDSQKAEHIGFYVDWSENRNYRKDLGYWINMVNAEVVGNIFDKGGMGYWNNIRKDFPEVFENRAKLERDVGYSMLKDNYGKPVFLDELDPNRGNMNTEIFPDCGIMCYLSLCER